MSKQQQDFFDLGELPKELVDRKVSSIVKQRSTILIIYSGKPIRFDHITKGENAWSKTCKNFEKQVKGVISDQETKQQILFYLTDRLFPTKMNDYDGNNKTTVVGGDDDNNHANNDSSTDEDKSQQATTTTIISVSEALRLHSGFVQVQGMISSFSELNKMISSTTLNCSNCGYINEIKHEKPESFSPTPPKKCPECDEYNTISTSHEYINAVPIELLDVDTFNDIERLRVVLFDENTKSIHAGERVIVSGNIYIIKTGGEGASGKSFSFLYADSIEYESKEDVTITDQDRKAIERFTYNNNFNNNDIIDRLVSMFAPSVIGYEHIKKGLLLCAVSTGRDILKLKRKRLNAFLVGDPGNAKTILVKEAIELVPNSRYESGQNSSGKSLTAIISKEEESHVLRLGPVPLAKEAICSINELGRMSFEDQAHLLDIMEEGAFTINKHGINARIRSPTVIIASANPINNSSWKDTEKIDLDEIPVIKPLIDRFDLIFVFRTSRDEEFIRRYAQKKADLDDKLIPNYYSYLKKHIIYAKQEFNPVLSEEARIMLTEYYVKIGKNFGSPRILETIFRLSKCISRLKLKNLVDSEDANETMQFYNVILKQYQQVVNITSNPRDIAYNECVNILKESKFTTAISFKELIKIACDRNERVKHYIGDKFRLQDNVKLRPLLDMLLNHPSINQTQWKPIVLQWSETKTINSDHDDGSDSSQQNVRISNNADTNNNLYDVYDAYDARTDTETEEKNKKIFFKNTDNNLLETSYTSYASYSNDRIERIHDFFDDLDSQYQPLPSHSFEESPCHPIIGEAQSKINYKNDDDLVVSPILYLCKLHPKVKSVHLSTIEHHCKYNDPELHKAEILRLLNIVKKDDENDGGNFDITLSKTAVNNNILYSQMIVNRNLTII